MRKVEFSIIGDMSPSSTDCSYGTVYRGDFHGFGIVGGESSAIIEITNVDTNKTSLSYQPINPSEEQKISMSKELKRAKKEAFEKIARLMNIPVTKLNLKFLD